MRPTKPAATAPRSARPTSGVVRLLQVPAVVTLAVVLAVTAPAQPQKASEAAPKDTFRNVPGTLSGEEGKEAERIKHPRSPEAARCTSKCVSTCVLGGAGAPGVGGPFNVRRPLVVFKDGFRSRQYCLVECSDVCNLIKDGEDDQ
ncbi:uncharacterized protein LOC124689702 [Lolium rigidum]|uniref:uncharacterized protein LOC124689702 n=1 Tax=Lolium rigidum TaxID=89674 RepID=UPI001F5CD1A3|nr:uncharacterized protein LOC124689702 [Lolium rigidum]